MPDRHHTVLALVRFLMAFITLEWVIHASTHLATHTGVWVFGLHGKSRLDAGWFSHDLEEVAGPAAAFVAVVLWIVLAKVVYGWKRRHNQARQGLPDKARGLVSFLSQYSPRGSGLRTHAEVQAAAEKASGLPGFGELRTQLLRSNWGPLCVAVQYHRDTLEHCWLICTEGERGSTGQYESACAALRKLLGKNAVFHKILLDDAGSVERAKHVVEAIYQVDLPATGLHEEEVVADFTPGTAAMTGGMVLATIAPGRKLEYLRQGEELASLTEEDIETRKLLIDAKAVVEQAPAHRAGRA